MADFHFIRPEWFFALIPLIWMLWQLNRRKLGKHGWQQIIPQHLVEHLMQGQSATHHQPFWLLAIIWFIVVTALAGPAWEKLPQPVYQTNTGKVLVMDMSQSMLATDLSPNRLTKARFKAIDLIDKIDDADMGLIAYSGDAFVISPLTADSKNLTALIPSLSPNIMPLIGSNAYAAFDLADDLLKNAGYSKGEIYWITDGIDQSELKDIRELLSNSQHRVSVLGVGTSDGAPIKQTSGELLKDSRGSIIIPKLNDSHLRAVARATGGAYTRITSTGIDIETLAQQELISREAKKEQDEQLHQGDQYREFGPIMVMLIIPFAAYAFRRGLVFALLLSSSLLLSTPAPVYASDGSNWWSNMWQTKDQQAANQYGQENYADAAQMFDNSQWKGSSLYKSGDYEGALKQFQQANDATGLYNQGNAHAKMQNFDEAIKAYEKALEQQPDFEDAKNNLELLKQMQQQQQQQDQQNQDGESQDQQNQDQQEQNQQNQQNQDQQGQQGEQQEQDGQQQQDGQQDDQQEQSQQNGQQGEQDDTKPREQQQQQGDQDPQAQQKEQQQEQSVPGEEKEGEEGEQGEQQLKPSDEQSTEEKEQMQEIQQLIRKINDDPAVLLRNKMQLEYQKRKYQNSSPPGAKSW